MGANNIWLMSRPDEIGVCHHMRSMLFPATVSTKGLEYFRGTILDRSKELIDI
jgi:hypothetical protein